MGQFRIEIVAIGEHGCDRSAKPGDKLHDRCGLLRCTECAVYDLIQTMKHRGVHIGVATFTHYPGTQVEVVDDMLKNERRKGQL